MQILILFSLYKFLSTYISTCSADTVCQMLASLTASESSLLCKWWGLWEHTHVNKAELCSRPPWSVPLFPAGPGQCFCGGSHSCYRCYWSPGFFLLLGEVQHSMWNRSKQNRSEEGNVGPKAPSHAFWPKIMSILNPRKSCRDILHMLSFELSTKLQQPRWEETLPAMYLLE